MVVKHGGVFYSMAESKVKKLPNGFMERDGTDSWKSMDEYTPGTQQTTGFC